MTEQPKVVVARVAVASIVFHPLNIRRDLGDLRALTSSVKQFGVMQPIVVEQHGKQLRLRAGHRRTAAARIAGLTTVPAVIHAHVLDDDEFVMQALHENVMRRGLDEQERRQAVQQLLALGCTAEGIATSLGVSGTTVRKWAKDPAVLVPRRGNTAPVTGKAKVRSRVSTSAVRKVVDQWTEKARDGLTPDEALQLLEQLTRLGQHQSAGDRLVAHMSTAA